MDRTNEVAGRERLRRAGLRATRPRLLVYSLLREIGGHRSVDDLVAALASRGQRVPRMSVYNVVADLQSALLVMSADAGPGRALYEAADHWHHHFVCRVCGRVDDVPCVAGHKPCLEPPADLAGTVDEAQVIFRGLCADCALRMKPPFQEEETDMANNEPKKPPVATSATGVPIGMQQTSTRR